MIIIIAKNPPRVPPIMAPILFLAELMVSVLILTTVGLRHVLSHEEQRARAIGQRRRVRGGDRSVLAIEHRLELRVARGVRGRPFYVTKDAKGESVTDLFA